MRFSNRDGMVAIVTDPEDGSEAVAARPLNLDPAWTVLPALADAHIHLDKSLLGSAWVPHSGSEDIASRVQIEEEILQGQQESLAARADRLLARLSSRGAIAVRTHVDVTDTTGLRHLDEIVARRTAWADRLSIDIVAFPQRGILRQSDVRTLLRDAMSAGATTVGGLDPETYDGDAQRHLDVVFGLATEFHRGIDVHSHERGETGAASLRSIAERTRDAGMQGEVSVSHALCLADLDTDGVAEMADLLADAGVTINTSLPGLGAIPPVPALLDRGVRVAIVSDNIRDSWSPFGKGDPLERACLAASLFGWKTDAGLMRALDLVSSAAIASIGAPEPDPAEDFLVVKAGSISEAVVDQPVERIVVRAGRVVAGHDHAERMLEGRK